MVVGILEPKKRDIFSTGYFGGRELVPLYFHAKLQLQSCPEVT